MRVTKTSCAAGLGVAMLLLLGCEQPSDSSPTITARALSLIRGTSSSALAPDAAVPPEDPELPQAPAPDEPPAPEEPELPRTAMDGSVPDEPPPREPPRVPEGQMDAGVPQEPQQPRTTATTPESESDALIAYTRACEEATGLKIDGFNCDDPRAVEPPGQEANSEGLCAKPNVLNGECDPGSKFQVLTKNSAGTAYAVAHCRKRGQEAGYFEDIAVIAYNRENGAVCFFQALNSLKGTEVKSPRDGVKPWYPNDSEQNARRSRWLTPTEMNAADPCVSCHDTGGFLRSPYLAQLTGEQRLPSTREHFDNLKAKPRFVGEEFKGVKTWSIELEKEVCIDDGDPEDLLTPEQRDELKCTVKRECRSCTTCHSLGISNQGRAPGTAGYLGLLATAPTQMSKLPHSCESPIWMKPNAVVYSQKAEEAAQKYAKCAEGWLDSLSRGVGEQPEGCIIKLNGAPWGTPRD